MLSLLQVDKVSLWERYPSLRADNVKGMPTLHKDIRNNIPTKIKVRKGMHGGSICIPVSMSYLLGMPVHLLLNKSLMSYLLSSVPPPLSLVSNDDLIVDGIERAWGDRTGIR